MARVFITQENPALNYAAAESYGDIEFLTRHDWSPVKQSLNNEQLVLDLRHKLKKFNPDEDYIVSSGSPVIAAVAFMLLREKTDRFRMLRWSNRDHVYYELDVAVKALTHA